MFKGLKTWLKIKARPVVAKGIEKLAPIIWEGVKGSAKMYIEERVKEEMRKR